MYIEYICNFCSLYQDKLSTLCYEGYYPNSAYVVLCYFFQHSLFSSMYKAMFFSVQFIYFEKQELQVIQGPWIPHHEQLNKTGIAILTGL